MRSRIKQTSLSAAVIYARVSTKYQRESGLGIAAQLTKCRDHAQRLNVPVIATYTDEGISGSEGIAERPGLGKAIDQTCDKPGAILIAYSLSRLARRQRLVWHILDDREGLGVPFSSASEPFDTASPMGRAMLGMLAVWAQLESDLVSERTVDALAAARDRGIKLGRPSLLESRIAHRERIIDPQKLAVVRRIRTLYASGEHSQWDIARMLNVEGVPTVSGRGLWHDKTIRLALRCGIPPSEMPIAAPQPGRKRVYKRRTGLPSPPPAEGPS